VKQRKQYGRTIGSFQAIKHQVADVRIALDFARPLVHGAALSMEPRAVSGAKVSAGDAAYLASRVALQVHGAIGYTQEHDLSLWLTKTRALLTTWGTPSIPARARRQSAARKSAASTSGPSAWGPSTVVGLPRPCAGAGVSSSSRACRVRATSSAAPPLPIPRRCAATARVIPGSDRTTPMS